MRWIERMKKSIRTWLNVEEANPLEIRITESLDYEGNAVKNRIWYRGDSNELQQLYEQISTNIDKSVDKYKFWASNSSKGMEIRKIHTGLPSMIIDMLAAIITGDLSSIEIENEECRDIWENIETDNDFIKKLEKAVKETLYIGDGAFKISYSKDISEYPIIEFFPGEKIEPVIKRDRLRAIKFKTAYYVKEKKYVLIEEYGYGYIKYKLMHNDKEVPLDAIEETAGLTDVAFAGCETDAEGNITKPGAYMMAVPIKFFESGKWDGRGQSVFDRKIDAFDAFDEVFSQWMDALRAGRTNRYIPESLIPRGINGELLKPNPFDNRFIKIADNMAENSQNKIDVESPEIRHESYLQSYITALDLCLQGLISPSTLGIDVKKLDNADAQREKEKATLYTRNAVIEALSACIPKLVDSAVRAYAELHNMSIESADAVVNFGYYANPSFESQIETVGKGKNYGIMSTEACVEELYGDSKDNDWKKEEVMRLKEEHGIATVEEPAVNLEGVNIDDV